MKYMVYPKAIAKLRGGKDFPQLRGTVRFFQRSDGTMIEAEVEGLPQTQTGFFAFHIHTGGNCGGEKFSNSGSHFNPGGTAHPNHAGNLPPLQSDHGKAYLKVLSGRFRVEEVIGKTVIIHSDPDDFHTQPAGNPGKKIACGVIQRS